MADTYMRIGSKYTNQFTGYDLVNRKVLALVKLLGPDLITDMAFTKTATKLVLLNQFQNFLKYITEKTYA